MKLRIRGDSIRFRLTQPEVTRLVAQGSVEDSTSFGVQRFVYAISIGSGTEVVARLVGSRIDVIVPESRARTWAESDDVSMEALQTHEPESPLRILVEKDFACLKERPHEDDADAFPNPKAT